MTYKLHAQWPNLQLEANNPFVSDAFLKAVEASGVCTAESGWQPLHVEYAPNKLLPCYLKSHSWGEYVFDFAWAQAYEQAGLSYYPKLVIAAPFTPSLGPRLLGVENTEQLGDALTALKQITQDINASGFHILFPNETERALLKQQDLLERRDVQFHWHNRNFSHFDDFLATFSSRKRKNVRKERQSVIDQGITLHRIEGEQLTDQHWHDFYNFYHATYLKRGRQGYLNKSFFDQLRTTMADKLMMVVAERDDQNIAAALFFKDETTLYGRYWGCFEEFNHLHFEACYYQGIDYCIAQGLKRFDPGTQGEHKIARGFEPTYTYSYHWLAHPQFMAAAKRFCQQEALAIESYYAQAQAALPFRADLNASKE